MAQYETPKALERTDPAEILAMAMAGCSTVEEWMRLSPDHRGAWREGAERGLPVLFAFLEDRIQEPDIIDPAAGAMWELEYLQQTGEKPLWPWLSPEWDEPGISENRDDDRARARVGLRAGIRALVERSGIRK